MKDGGDELDFGTYGHKVIAERQSHSPAVIRRE